MSIWTPYNDMPPLDLSLKNRHIINSLMSYPTMERPYVYTIDDVLNKNSYKPPSSSILHEKLSTAIEVLSPPTSPYSPSTKNESLGMAVVEALENDPNFLKFEKDALRTISEKNGGTLLGHNPRMRRAVQTGNNVDDSYRKQRERNNYAAKQSRDKRKLREIRLALKITSRTCGHFPGKKKKKNFT